MRKELEKLTISSFTKSQLIVTRLETLGIETFLQYQKAMDDSEKNEIVIYVNESKLNEAQNILDKLNFEINQNNKSENSAFNGLFIIPVDFSTASENACKYAFELANRFNSRIKLIHTYGIPDFRSISFDDSDFYSGVFTQQLDDLRKEAENNMKKLVQILTDYGKIKNIENITINYNIVNGLIEEVLLYTSNEEHANLIIIGLTKKDLRIFELVGKVAGRIIEKAKCPVLIIPVNTIFKGLENVKNILYLTDFDEMDFAAIHKLIGFVKKINSKIKLLHISEVPGDPWDEIKLNGLKDYFTNAYQYENVSCQLIYGDNMLDSLNNYIENNAIDIITMTAQKRGIIWKYMNPSITQKIVYHTKIPLLVFHS